MPRALAILFLLAFTGFSEAQDMGTGFESGTNLNVLYRSDASGMVYANTRGFGALFRRGKHVTSKTRSYYEIDLQLLNHPKEISTTGEGTERSRFVYGKINSVILLRGSVGMQNTLFAKADNRAVEVRYAYSIGPLIAFAKPYYVMVYKGSSSGRLLTPVRFDQENFTQDSGRIAGRASFAKGLSEVAFYPGVSAKFNLSFEYAPYTNLIRAIETGVTLDYYPKALAIMARNPAENFILTLHIGFVMGKKWF